MHLRGGLACFLCAGFLVAGSARASEESELRELGAGYYRSYCASCHGLSGKGDGPVANVLTARPADLTRLRDDAGGEFPLDRVARSIDGRTQVEAHGPRNMPVWGVSLANRFPESEISQATVRAKIDALLAYIESIQVPRASD